MYFGGLIFLGLLLFVMEVTDFCWYISGYTGQTIQLHNIKPYFEMQLSRYEFTTPVLLFLP